MLPKARKDDLVVQGSGDELLVYDLKENQAICLNRTSKLIWEKCDGAKSPWEIRKSLEEALETSIDEDIVWLGLAQLNEKGLLEKGADEAELLEQHSGLSRREVVKRIGLTSVAIPIVASLVAPTAVQAQTCMNPPGSQPNGTPCTESCGCMSGCCGEDRMNPINNGVCRAADFTVDAGGGCVGDGIGTS